MNQSARVGSIEALAAFRAALIRFAEECQDGATSLRLESRRGAEWVEVEQSRYWPQQAREANDAVHSARVNLERCELAVRPEDRRSCYEEKKALEAARRRVRLCEEKVRTVRKWAQIMNQEAREFHGEIARLEHYLESDLPRAIAMLERMITALEKYATSTAPPPTSSSSSPTSAVDANPDNNRESS